MQHNFLNTSFGFSHIFICFLTTRSNSSKVLKYLLWVHALLVIFHTLSIWFRSGLYGGRKTNSILCLFFLSHGWIIVAWWYLALSSINIIFFPLFFDSITAFKKFKNVSALKIVAVIDTICPVLTQTAPNKDRLFLVGACNKTGSASSGGTHILHRVPCC